MRLWSLHPKYLDPAGLVALWREGLLAKKVLEGKTRGYRNHPQLLRFKASKNPLKAVNAYLGAVLEESVARGYKFDGGKIRRIKSLRLIKVTKGQVKYETQHLRKKLKKRNMDFYAGLKGTNVPCVNPVFIMVNGKKENWEK